MAPGLALAPPAEVRPAPPSSAPTLAAPAALAAARAEAAAGREPRALAILLRALPNAGSVAGVLRVEAARLELRAGRDPYVHLAPLLSPGTPRALRRAAEELALQAVQELPLAKAAGWLSRPLPQPLRRQIRGTLARRQKDQAGMLQIVAEKPEDALSGELARELLSDNVPPDARELLARALFHAGYWRESHQLLLGLPFQQGETYALTFLRARTAYRLERWEEAVFWFAEAERAASSVGEKAACWLFAARAWEQMGQETCAEELYRRLVALRPDGVEGWTGLVQLLARGGRERAALELVQQAPSPLRREVAPRLCATLVLRGKPEAAQEAALLASPVDPAARLCAGFVALHLGQRGEAQNLFASVLADPKAGRLRELVSFALPQTEDPQWVEANRQLEPLAGTAVRKGLTAGRESLLLSLRADPRWAPLLDGQPPTPVLPAPVAGLVEAGFALEVATLLPHLLPRSSPADLAWSASFLAASGNCSEALRFGEHLWRLLGPIPASLLPDPLLPHLLPPPCARVVPATFPLFRVLLVALARQESRFDPRALSPVGARGVWQLMPLTMARFANDAETTDPDAGGHIALRHLQFSAQRLGFDPLTLAAAYNAGQAWVELWVDRGAASHPLLALAVPYAETRGYLLAVAEGLFLARYLK